MIEGRAVADWFSKHPDMAARIEKIRFQTKYPSALLDSETIEDLYRPLKISDIRFIDFQNPVDGSAGIFVWYYPLRAPHYVKIGEIEEVNE